MVFIARAAEQILPGCCGRQRTKRITALEYAASMHPMLNIAVRAARRAGSIINRATLDGGALQVRSKRANDFVTRVDGAAEEAVIDIVRKAYPDHGFIAEESGESTPDAEYLW